MFRNLEKAKQYLMLLAKRSLSSKIVTSMDTNGDLWYHVRTGRFVDAAQARGQLPGIEKKGFVYGVVVKETKVEEK
jgi:hypothetical protein